MKYRIRARAHPSTETIDYYGQLRPWWWPFWQPFTSYYPTPEEVEARIVVDKAFRSRQRYAESYIKHVK